MKKAKVPEIKPGDNWFVVLYKDAKYYVKYSTKENLMNYYLSLHASFGGKMPKEIRPIKYDESSGQITEI